MARVLLLGTGAADGWPNAFCGCASCAWARGSGQIRTTTSALVDDALLLDCGPGTAHQAARAGVPLDRVRAVLVTHAHPDHLAPQLLLGRHWARARGPLRVLGPESALAACRPWLGPDDPVELEAVVPGTRADVDGYQVRVLAAAHDVGTDVLASDAVLFDVTAPDGTRLLWATDTGPLPAATIDAVAGARFDLVLLEETFGSRSDHGTGHLDLATFPHEVRRLREAGAVAAGSDLVAVHLGHHNPPGPELDRVLASWGARAGADLEAIETGGRPAPTAAARSRTLLLGGARSGKSREAERRLAAEPAVDYVATAAAPNDDAEWAARIGAHRDRRPTSWATTETLDVADVLSRPGPPVLVDCLALWLAGVLDRHRVWESSPGSPGRAEALGLVEARMDELVDAVRTTARRVILVSNEVGSGVVPEHESGRLYRDLLGRLNARVAAECDVVDLVVAGHVLPLRHEGRP